MIFEITQLLARNLEVAANIERGSPATAPGVALADKLWITNQFRLR